MRTTPVSSGLAFFLAALAFGRPVALAEGDAAPTAASRKALTSNPPALPFFAVAPCRLADTRSSGGLMLGGQIRAFQITGSCNIPPQAQAVSFNFSVTETQGTGFFVAYPQGGAFPPVSILNFLARRASARL